MKIWYLFLFCQIREFCEFSIFSLKYITFAKNWVVTIVHCSTLCNRYTNNISWKSRGMLKISYFFHFFKFVNFANFHEKYRLLQLQKTRTVWDRNLILSSIYAQPMTLIEICGSEIEKTKIWLLLGYFLQKWLNFLREGSVWGTEFVLAWIDAQYMTFIEVCKAEIEETKIWLLLGYFCNKNGWFF